MTDTNDSSAPPSPDGGPAASPERQRADWRAERRRERAERRAGWSEAWAGVPVGALILIGLGLFFLLRNLGFSFPDNWWAVFLLIPACGALVAAIRLYRAEGRWTNEALGALIPGIVFLALFAAFFFNFAWGIFWPVILLAVGFGLLVRSYWR